MTFPVRISGQSMAGWVAMSHRHDVSVAALVEAAGLLMEDLATVPGFIDTAQALDAQHAGHPLNETRA
jgi:hypothetical protein